MAERRLPMPVQSGPSNAVYSDHRRSSKMLNIGDRAPSFSLASDSGKAVKLSDFKGSTLILYFFPKADTPG